MTHRDELQTDTQEEELRRLAEKLSGLEWYVLGPPWVGYTDTFTILRGSPDPHTGVAILETIPNEEADETDDHYEQQALAEWLQRADPNAWLALLDRIDALEGELSQAREKLADLREALEKIADPNTTVIERCEKSGDLVTMPLDLWWARHVAERALANLGHIHTRPLPLWNVLGGE